jgi:hypothetical protein
MIKYDYLYLYLYVVESLLGYETTGERAQLVAHVASSPLNSSTTVTNQETTPATDILSQKWLRGRYQRFLLMNI